MSYQPPAQSSAQSGGNNRTIIIVVIVVLVLCCCCLVLVGGYLALTQGYLNGILPSILTPTPGAHSLLQLIA